MAAKGKGAGHFVALRFAAIVLAVLAPWFALSAAFTLRDGGYQAATEFLTEPMNALGVALLAVVALYHMALGMEEVILDYIAKPGTKSFLLFLNGAACVVLGLAALYALYSLNFGA